MPIITFVVGYIYLVFGSFKTFQLIGFGFKFSCILSAILAIIFSWHIYKIAKATSGNLVCPRTFALQMLLTHFSMIVVIIAIASLAWLPQTSATKSVSFALFLFFGYLLNIGAGTFPTFSVADPFYWNQNRSISPSYDRALKSVLLGVSSYCFAQLTFLWHSVATMGFIFVDVVLMAHYWEIAGVDDWEEPRREENNEILIQENDIVEDLHMD
ncbi:hypothetical protein GCK72_002596 [Caenorhabditis remanei]|uniref:Uncharacterized protein n=1 Tax=Caenorhabditis remanei TaxID=31234 RepID=A0A6A5HWM0_CAERE|nr:hypothetical protein GCK72_002596 [Caenorhabditis remanei]KAF1770773.1 hypothetical protein GCK72_002596 [Caenorhabditis remanei]